MVMNISEEKQTSWLDFPLLKYITLNAETIIFVIILFLAIVSRFYDLGARVMSHDENTHVFYSWRFYRGEGFAHDPLMHGPLLFHLTAFSYLLFGDNDFTARLPQALFGILTVGFMLYYRRYFGRAGALIAAGLMLISPYILYYGRYARNEAFVGLFGVVMIWAILRYLESGQNRYLYWLTGSTVLHFTSKETSFIYTAQALLFLAFYLIYRLMINRWRDASYRRLFLFALIISLLLLATVGAFQLLNHQTTTFNATQTVEPSVPGQELPQLQSSTPAILILMLIILCVLGLMVAAYCVIKGYSIENIRSERSFGLLIILGTLVLPQLSAFPIRILGWTLPTNASEVTSMTFVDILHIAVIVIPLLLLSILIGLWWNRRVWLINAAIWYSLFTVFYTSVFSNGAGFFTGLVGSLGYWLEQQGVNRGSQPWYYYGLVQIPLYEYLPALGTVLAFLLYFLKKRVTESSNEASEILENENSNDNVSEEDTSKGEKPPAEPIDVPVMLISDETIKEKAPVFPLLGFWSFTSLIAYSIAGEKMPWLTVHITLPMILCSGWAFGQLIDRVDWSTFWKNRGWLIIVLFPILLLSFLSTIGSLLGAHPPFQGKTLEELSATSTFITSLLVTLGGGIGIYYLVRLWPGTQLIRLGTLSFFVLLAFLTTRVAIQSSFYNYNDANELLVYAHSAGGVKQALTQIEEISRRTTDGLGISIAYDNETTYPYWWYLRNYPNQRYFGADPTRSLRESPLILVGDANFGKIEPVVGESYYRFEYIRLWWPNQDYFGFTWERIKNALVDPSMREALFQIWLNRDYTIFGQVTNRDLSLPNWSPAARMRLYIRKDVVNQLWNYGAPPVAEATVIDPFEKKQIQINAQKVIGLPGNQPGQFQNQRDLEVAPDGTLYVVDTGNNRIQHLSSDGTVLGMWGSTGDATTGEAPGGTFNQPWGIGLGPDGSVYIADTWNHRIQKFTADGEFIAKWGFFGQGETPEAFWGPRDVAVSSDGLVYVTDTGNKRVVVFDQNGNFITQFGGAGLLPGQLDEPVGIAIDKDGLVYVADTWNQRVQVFERSTGETYGSVRSWEILGWYGQSLDNKPYLTLDNQGHVYVSDPEGCRILEFTSTGEAVRAWGDCGAGINSFSMAASVAVNQNGDVWVSDAANSRLLLFVLPTQ
jgi:uncharacterized protein (TIGR03663 family)